MGPGLALPGLAEIAAEAVPITELAWSRLA